LAAVSAKEAMGCFVALSSLLLLASCLMLYRKWEWLRWVRLSMFGFWGWSVVALAYHLWLREAPGVIIAAEAKVYSGIGKQNVVLFLLHEGVELSIVDSSQLPWVRIRLADGKQGWLPSENLTFEKGL